MKSLLEVRIQYSAQLAGAGNNHMISSNPVINCLNLFAQRFCKLYSSLKLHFTKILAHANLLFLLIRRDIAARTSGTILGGFWMLLQPALQVSALWFLLDIVLKVRLSEVEGGFAGYYLTGIIPWLMITEIILKSLSVLNDYATLYHRAIFPIAILPLVPWSVSGAIYLVVFFIVSLVLVGLQGAFGALALIGFLLIWLLPLSYLLSVIGLFFRDVQQAAPFVMSMLLYLTPILYLPSAFPESLRWWLVVNPFAYWMTIAHGWIQGLPWRWVDVAVIGSIWAGLLLPATWIFKRSLQHVREAI